MPSCSTRALSISSTSPCAQVNSHYVNLSIYVVRHVNHKERACRTTA